MHSLPGLGVVYIDLIRIGEKLVSLQKIAQAVEQVLTLRSQGYSQQEVANQLGVDRAFISRLESLGEIRKGGSIALIGFPISNKDEIRKVAEEAGVDFILLMNDEERWSFVRDKSGIHLFNEIMSLTAKIRAFDAVIMIGSSLRTRLAKALLDREVIPVEIGETPISEDKYVDPEEIRKILAHLRP